MAHSFVDGGRYDGKVVEAAFVEAKSGTRGFQILLEDAGGAGSDYFVIWLTSSAAEGAKRSFEALGLGLDKLQNPAFHEADGNGLIRAVVGRTVPFWTKNEEYKGVSRIKVGGIGEGGGLKVVKVHGGEVADYFASCFPKAEDDDNIPFALLLPALLPALMALGVALA